MIIFDKDKNKDNKLENLKKKLENFKDDIGNKIFIFLFPNNIDEGELETLLYKIAKYPEVVQCFDGYRKCIEHVCQDFEHNIHKKSKIYAYYEAIGKIGKDKKPTSYHFDFESEALEPLKRFIQEHLF